MSNFVKPISEIVYSDLDMSFKAHPISGKVRIKHNIEAIKQSLKCLIMYNKYDVPFESDMYGGIRDLLFDLIDGDTVSKAVIRTRIESVIQRYEPRAVLNDVEVGLGSDDHTINITVIFTPINATEAVRIDLFLERIR